MTYSRDEYESNLSKEEIRSLTDELIGKNYTSINHKLYSELRNKYTDGNIVDTIVQALKEKVSSLHKKARRFAEIIIKYSDKNTPMTALLKRAYQYKDKVKLTDSEFELFRRILIKNLNEFNTNDDNEDNESFKNTVIAKALGDFEYDSIEGLYIEQTDIPYLQDILRQYAVTQQLHKNIYMQSLLYRDLDLHAMLGEYDYKIHNVTCCVHPVIAAMFLPKIDLFESIFLKANIAGIIKAKYEKTKLQSQDDTLLLVNLSNNPTDMVCDIDSVYKDIKIRCVLQEKLWLCVNALRNGRYYDCLSAHFMPAIDNCKLAISDAPDIIYLNDEASIVRKLFQAFALRPIIVESAPVQGINISTVTHYLPIKNRISSIPMISIRIPIKYDTAQDEEVELIDLAESAKQPQFFLEQNKLVLKTQNIIYTHGVIVYHVPRKMQQPSYIAHVDPNNFRNVLPTLTGFEKCNTTAVDPKLTQDIKVGSTITTVLLRSILVLTINPFIPDLIVGSSAIIIDNNSVTHGTSEYYNYSPQFVTIVDYTKQDDKDVLNRPTPIYKIAEIDENKYHSYRDLSTKYGTIYIYSVNSKGIIPPAP